MEIVHELFPVENVLCVKAERKGIPLYGAFELTPLCNLECPMCYVREPSANIYSSDQWLAVGEAARNEGMLFLLLTGGEPFLYPDFFRLYEGLQNMGLILTINTNATLIDEEKADWLADHRPRCINVSFYGVSENVSRKMCGYSSELEAVKRALRLLKKRNLPVRLNVTMTPDNIGELQAIKQFAKEWDLPLELSHYLFPPNCQGKRGFGEIHRLTPEEAARVRYEAHQIHPPMWPESREDIFENHLLCRAGVSSFWIDWRGKLTPCKMMKQLETDVFSVGFAKGWKEVQKQCREIRTAKACAACPRRKYCQTCGAVAIAETGKVNGVPRYLCDLTHAYLER